MSTILLAVNQNVAGVGPRPAPAVQKPHGGENDRIQKEVIMHAHM